MKKFICILLVVVIVASLCCACGNRQMFDTTWTFDRAIIFLPDGEKIEGRVTSWKDYASSDMIQVEINGDMYMTHSTNVILIAD